MSNGSRLGTFPPHQHRRSHVCVGLCSSQSLLILQLSLTPEEEDLYCRSAATPGTVSLESHRKGGIIFFFFFTEEHREHDSSSWPGKALCSRTSEWSQRCTCVQSILTHPQTTAEIKIDQIQSEMVLICP